MGWRPARARFHSVSVPRRWLRSSASTETAADSRPRGPMPTRPSRGSGMPETIRATGGSLKARLRRKRFWISAAAGALSLLPGAALAQDTAAWPWPFSSPYVAALAQLEQHEIAALALILGVIFFAVLTAILLGRHQIHD